MSQESKRVQLVSALFQAGWDLKYADHFSQDGIPYVSVPFGKGIVRFQPQGNGFTAISYRDPTGKLFILSPSPDNISPTAFAELITKAALDD